MRSAKSTRSSASHELKLEGCGEARPQVLREARPYDSTVTQGSRSELHECPLDGCGIGLTTRRCGETEPYWRGGEVGNVEICEAHTAAEYGGENEDDTDRQDSHETSL